MKTVKTLLNAYNDMRVGNHKVAGTTEGRDFIYFSTVICSTNDRYKTFKVDNGGYWTPSTAKAISAYRTELRRTHSEHLDMKIERKKRNGNWVAVDQVGKEWEIDPNGYKYTSFYKGYEFKATYDTNGDLSIQIKLAEVM